MKFKRAFGDEAPTTEKANEQPPTKDKTYTQSDIDKIVQERLAVESKKFQKEKAELLTKLEAASTSAAEKEKLREALEDLQKQNMTKEQLTEKKYQDEKIASEKKLKAAEEAAARWQRTYQEEKIIREIMDAAAPEAYNPSQIVALLKPDAKLSEKIDPETGKPVGIFETRIRLNVTKDGKTVELDCSPSEAVKVMKEDVDRFGNLFKANVSGGIGGSAPKAGGKANSLKDVDQETINELWRTKGTKALGGR